jgi:DNA-binding NtrC family response regulator
MFLPGRPIIQTMAPIRQATSVPVSSVAMSGIQVLVVDDAAPVRDLLVNYFVKHRMVVTAVGDGLAAIQTLERNPGRFGLVITDLNMPGADGFAVLMEARRTNPDCAVVIVTGYATLDSAIQAVRVGAYDYLPKPFNLSEVDRLLTRIATDKAWHRDDPAHEEQQDTIHELRERIRHLEERLAAMDTPLDDLSLLPAVSDGAPTLR